MVSSMESIKNIGELPRMARLDTFPAAVIEKIFKPLVRKADDHSKNVTDKVTFSKEQKDIPTERRYSLPCGRSEGSSYSAQRV
jgi:hypothetical protein